MFSLRRLSTNIFSAICLLYASDLFAASPIIVTSSVDGISVGTLRWAITQANADIDVSIITFAVSSPVNVSLPLDVQYPVIIEGVGTTIVGTSSENIFNIGGLSSSSVIRNLALVGGDKAIILGSNYNIIQNCSIGTDWSGASALGNSIGVYVTGSGNLIGGSSSAGQGNVISGNNVYGVYIDGSSASSAGNSLCGNVIGLNRGQSAGLPNGVMGVMLRDAEDNWIGVPGSGLGNVICSQEGTSATAAGIYVEGGEGNIITNNYIGLNVSNVAFANKTGIVLSNTSGTLVGGDVNVNSWVRNFISGNKTGIQVTGGVGQIICGNYLGTAADGQMIRENVINTVLLSNAAGCLIGGAASGYRNLICGNGGDAIKMTASGMSTGNTITGNTIGMTADGNLPAQNFSQGVSFGNNCTDNVIGGIDGYGNVIAGVYTGVSISGANSVRNAVLSNAIHSFANSATGRAVWLQAANNGKPAPDISFGDASSLVIGSAQAWDYIELFQSDRKAGYRGGSLRYLGSALATGTGYWSVSVAASNLWGGDAVCASASDTTNGSSEYSLNYVLTGPTPTPTATATPVVTPTLTPAPVAANAFVRAAPNPGHERVDFVLDLVQPADVKISIYNMTGERVAVLYATLSGQGAVLSWNCSQAAKGIYLARVSVDNKELAKVKVAVIR